MHEGLVLCRVTVNMTGAPLGSRVWVDPEQAWTTPLLEKGMLVPIDPATGADVTLEAPGESEAEDMPPEETEALPAAHRGGEDYAPVTSLV